MTKELYNGYGLRLGDCVIAESPHQCIDGVVIEIHDDDTFTLLDFDENEPVWVNAHVVEWEIYERQKSTMSSSM